jgi:LmbE family N-acetylglucosaminyl deacetylase
VLCIAAHPDDEVLGAGGTISVLAASGISVRSCILVGDAEARGGRPETAKLHADSAAAAAALGVPEPILGRFPNIELNTVPHLQLVQFIESAMGEAEADVLITHHPADLNVDHRETARASEAAARLFQRKTEFPRLRALLYMEVLSSTDWAPAIGDNPFEPRAFFEVGEGGIEAKLRALSAYGGVMRPYPHPRSAEAIRALATLRGGQAGMRFAEAFQIGFIDLATGVGIDVRAIR